MMAFMYYISKFLKKIGKQAPLHISSPSQLNKMGSVNFKKFRHGNLATFMHHQIVATTVLLSTTSYKLPCGVPLAEL